MTPELQPVLDLAQAALDAKQLGVLGVLGVSLAGFVKIFKLPMTQQLLGSIPKVGPYLAWGNLSPVGRLFFVFLFSSAGALLSAVAMGTGWGAAAVGALVVGLTAIGTHQVGSAVTKKPSAEAVSLRVPYDPAQDPNK
jgi:hypothetical protein